MSEAAAVPLWKKLVRLQNPLMIWLLNSPLHGSVSDMYMLIRFTGRKSGKAYTIPVQYGRTGDTLYVITSKDYVWWRNLQGGADVTIRLRGKNYAGISDISTDLQAIRAGIAQVHPRMKPETMEIFTRGKVLITITLPATPSAAPA